MAGQEQALTVKITAKADDADSAMERLGQNIQRVVTAQNEAAQAAQASSEKQQGAYRQVSAAQQAVIDDMQARAKQYAAVEEATTNAQLALKIKTIDHETQMGRQSLDEQLERLQELMQATEASSAARIASERAVQTVYADLVQRSIGDMRTEVAEGKISAEQRIAALRSIASEAEYSLGVRAQGVKELARIEEEAAKRSAGVVKAAEQEKVEARKHSQELAYLVMDMGYMVPGGAGMELANMAYLMRDITSASPAMIAGIGAVTVAFAALGATGEFLAHSAESAEKYEQNMRQLGAIVKAQGGDWESLKGKIEEFADLQEKTTTFSDDEVIESLRGLMRAGVSAGDAMKIVRVAEDGAAASGHSLKDITHGLMEAAQGHTRALTELGIGTKESIKDGMSFNEVLAAIERQMGGSAQAAVDTYGGKLAQLHNQMDNLQKKVGNDLLPILSSMADGTSRMVDAVDKDLPKAEKAWNDFEKSMKSAIGWIEDNKATATVGALSAAVFVLRDSLLGAAVAGGEAFVAGMGKALVAVYEFLAGVGPVGWVIIGVGAAATGLAAAWDHNWGHIREVSEDAINGIIHAMGGLLVKLSEAEYKLAGFAQSAPGGLGQGLANTFRGAAQGAYLAGVSLEHANVHLAPHFGSWAPPASKPPANPAKTHTGITTEIGGGSGSKGGGFVAGEVSDRESGFDPTFKDLSARTDVVKQQIEALRQHEADLQHSLRMTTNEADYNAKAHQNQAEIIKTYGDEVVKIRQLLEGETLDHQHQEQVVTNLYNAYESTAKGLQKYRNSLDGVHQLSHAQAEELKRLENAEKDADKAFKEAESTLKTIHGSLAQHEQDLQSVADKWHGLKNAAEETIPDLERKWGDFLRKQATQAQEATIATHGTWAQQSSWYYQMMDSINATDDQSLQEKESYYQKYQQIIDAHLRSVEDEIAKEEDSLVDGIVTKHQSLRDTLKNIWSDIEKDYVRSFERMLTDKTLRSINESMANALSPGGGGGSSMSAGMANVVSFMGGSSSGKPDGSSGSPLFVKLHDDSLKGITGASGGLSGASGSGLGLPVEPSSTAGGVYATDSAGGLYGASPAKHSAIASAMQDFMAGQMASSMLNPGGNQTGSMIGDLLGTGVGLLTKANPLAGIALGIGGSLIGSLFGPHTTPEQKPDTSQVGYQQWLANYQGAVQNSHGNLTYAEGQYDTTIGGKSLAQQMSAYIGSASNYASAPAGMKAVIDHLRGIAGPGGSLALNANDPESQGMFHLANGKSVKVTDLEQWVNELQRYQGSGGSSTPVYQLSRTYPSFQGAIGPQVGSVNDQTGAFTVAPNVNVTVNGSLIGATGVDELSLIISQGIRRISTGQAPGTQGTRQTLSSGGDF